VAVRLGRRGCGGARLGRRGCGRCAPGGGLVRLCRARLWLCAAVAVRVCGCARLRLWLCASVAVAVRGGCRCVRLWPWLCASVCIEFKCLSVNYCNVMEMHL